MGVPRLKQPKDVYVVDYPEAIRFAEQQSDIFWTDREIDVSKDIQDIRVNMTPAEKHGTITTLKLFTAYELKAGNEYWGGRVMRMFKRPDIRRMANAFAFFELNSHMPFYAKLNEALGLASEEFYNSYIQNPILKERMDFIDSIVADKDDLVSLGAFTFVEGVVLYSSFAFLKHFQAKGKNKLKNVVSGINFSVRDENLHAMGGAWLFRQLLSESKLDDTKKFELDCKLFEVAKSLYRHELEIIKMIFEQGPIEGITEKQLIHFVESRINLCLKELGLPAMFDVKYNPIKDWFYKSINTIKLHDFFAALGNAYNRNWDEKKFGNVWRKASV